MGISTPVLFYEQCLSFKEDLMRALAYIRENISVVFMCHIDYQSH